MEDRWPALKAKLRAVLLSEEVEEDFIEDCLKAVGSILIPDFDE